MPIFVLTLIFAAVSVAALLVAAVVAARRLPARMQVRLEHRLTEHLAAAAAVAAAYRTASPDERARLASSHRYFRAAALALDPRAEVVDLSAAKPRLARAA